MSGLPWHRQVWQALRARVANQTVPHAILLAGPAGIGKWPLATAFAASLLCERVGPDGAHCGKCRGCTFFAAGSHPDYHLCIPLEDSRQIRIDQIRGLAQKSALTSSIGRYQVFLVSPADAMNPSAANAFLKTLEEPSPNSVIVLLIRVSCQQQSEVGVSAFNLTHRIARSRLIGLPPRMIGPQSNAMQPSPPPAGRRCWLNRFWPGNTRAN